MNIKYIIPTILIGFSLMYYGNSISFALGVDDSAAESKIQSILNDKNEKHNERMEKEEQERQRRRYYPKYTVEKIEKYSSLNIDVNNDGVEDEIAFQAQEYQGTYQKETECMVMVDIGNSDDDKILDESYYGSFEEAYLVTSENNKKYIIAEIKEDEEDSVIASFSLNDKHSLICNGGFMNMNISSEYGFKIFEKSNMLGEHIIYKNCKFIENGSGITSIDEEYQYHIDENILLTVKMNLPVFIYGNNGSIFAETLKPETKLQLVKTDGESIIYAKLENGKMCQINVNYFDKTYSINNIQAKYYFYETSDN